MVGILYCEHSALSCEELERLLSTRGIAVTLLDINHLQAEALKSVSVLINIMGSYCPEEKLALLVDFFKAGHNIINLGATPFMQGCLSETPNTRLLRSFDIVDDFRPISAETAYIQTASGERLNASLHNLQGAVYHLCEKDADGSNVRTAYLEHILEAFNAQDSLVAVPIIRVVTHAMGSMCFWNFAFDNAMLQNPFWQKLLIETIKKELTGNILLTVDCDLARYAPEEPQQITIQLKNITMPDTTPLHVTVAVYDSSKHCVFQQERPASLPYEDMLQLRLAEPSLYQVITTVTHEDICITQNQTGFLVLDDASLTKELQSFQPMYIDETVSRDTCLINGEVTAILGTTYFVTDVYRQCFYYMNAWLCDQEMAQLASDGFNVLRSGNWVYIPALYESDGSISKRGIRALQTYFLLAARHGFTVQFALGNVMLNPWDKTKSPIHHPDMRRKCMTLVRSFAENFKSYPNVTLDIVNEPSYSYKGAWSPGKPSYESGELLRYRTWLTEKYQGSIARLQQAWGESAASIKSFEDIEMPPLHLFSRGLCRTEQRYNHTPLADFFAFARQEFSAWTKEVRETVRQYAPNMPVIMGRDETLRIPAQQDEVLAGNIDMVCWHQWNYNSDILTEYLLNHVPGKICVAQEMGMYKFDDVRGGKRHSDEEMADRMEKKLLYGFGNFVQWQAHDDPFMFELSENSLGLYRADMSPTPSLLSTKAVIQAERSMQHLRRNRVEEHAKIITLYNTSYYFGVDNPFAWQGIRNHVYTLFHCLKEQSNIMLEHLFTKENAAIIGQPKLIILPAMQTLQRDTWQFLLDYVREGTTLLINGCIDKDQYFAPDAKIAALDSGYSTRKLRNFEKIHIVDEEYVLHYRPLVGYADVTNLLDCGQTADGNCIKEYRLGQGTILYCPYPLELSAGQEATCACYEYAIAKAQAQNNLYAVLQSNPNTLLLATAYETCTVYTLINEGFGDTLVWTDLRSGHTFTAHLPENCGGKLWISKDGKILQQFGKISVSY